MATSISIPLVVIVRAAEALKAAQNTCTGTPMSLETWIQVMKANLDLRVYVNTILESQEVSID